MLSSDDSRRLAQLERQLLQDDPEFCARMSGGQPPQRPSGARLPVSLILTAAVIWVTALILGIVGWWAAAAIAALWATVVVAAVVYRLTHRRFGSG